MHVVNFYAGMPFDRGDALRKQAERIRALLADPRSRVIPLWRHRHLVTAGDMPQPVWFSVEQFRHVIETAEVETVLLGLDGEVAHFCIDLSHVETPEETEPLAGRGQFVDLRAVGPLLPRDQGAVMAYARGMLYWHRRHRFCGVCGSPTVSTSGGHVRQCTSADCGEQHFPRTDPAVIMLVTRGEYCLLGRSPRFPPGMHSTLAGFVEPGESLEEAVIREVWEETGIRCGDVRYQSSQPWPFPSSIMLGFHATALTERLEVNTDELESAAWYHRSELHEPPSERLRLPRTDSIARRLIDDWLREE